MELKLRPLPPDKAIEAFRRRGFDLRDIGDWEQVAAREHAKSFTVAQSMYADVLSDIFAAMDKAQAEGIPFSEFKAQLEPLLVKKGWWGKKTIIDQKTGEMRRVQLGSAHRLRTIMRTNLRVSHAAGRAHRIAQHSKRKPWLEYQAVLDSRTRDAHRNWDGVVLRHDDPWWETHMPPNGWGCRCGVALRSKADLKRRKLKPGKAPSIRKRPYKNKRTGEVKQVPEGIDPGWDHDPGREGLLAGTDAKLRDSVDRLSGHGKYGADAAANLLGLDERIREGRNWRRELTEAAGGIDASDFAERFRAEAKKALRNVTGEAVEAKMTPLRPGHKGDKEAARRVKEASRLFPASWVRRTGPAKVEYNGQATGGAYYPDKKLLDISDDPGNALHEFAHHVQSQNPALDAHYLALHRRRTVGEEIVRLRYKDHAYPPGTVGRRGSYVEQYAGREYGLDEAHIGNTKLYGQPREVMTRAIQMLWHPVYGDDLLIRMIEKNDESLSLTLGLLFRYNPPL